MRFLIQADVILIIMLSGLCGISLVVEWIKSPMGAAPWFKLVTAMMIGNVPYWTLNLIVFMAYIPELPSEKHWVVLTRLIGLTFPTFIVILATYLVAMRKMYGGKRGDKI